MLGNRDEHDGARSIRRSASPGAPGLVRVRTDARTAALRVFVDTSASATALTTGHVFQRMIAALDQAGIPYMLTGSFASSYHGTPRATQDIDIVISPTPEAIRALLKLLPDTEYYIDADAALDAQKRQGQFNVIDFATGWKVDLIVRKSRAFSREEFDRRAYVDFQGMKLAIATAEDVIIAKLEWAKMGESQRQVSDAAGIMKVGGEHLDLDYVRRWVRDLDLSVQWDAACGVAGIRALL